MGFGNSVAGGHCGTVLAALEGAVCSELVIVSVECAIDGAVDSEGCAHDGAVKCALDDFFLVKYTLDDALFSLALAAC